jgi:hypothetical protein
MPAAYIYDGYTQPGRINAVDGLHPEVNFLFRPKFGGDRAEVYSRMKLHAEGRNREDIVDVAIAGSMVEWDVRDGNDGTVPIHPQHVARLHPKVKLKMFEQVMANQPAEEAAKN